MKKLFLSLALALTLLPMRAADDKTMQRIAAIYQSVASPSDLRGNTELISLLTEVLQRADQTSLTALNTYGKYIYANGMLAVVEQSIAKMPAALKDTEEGRMCPATIMPSVRRKWARRYLTLPLLPPTASKYVSTIL